MRISIADDQDMAQGFEEFCAMIDAARENEPIVDVDESSKVAAILLSVDNLNQEKAQ